MSTFAGIDISAKTFDVVVRHQGKSQRVQSYPQTVEGHQRCLKDLQRINPARVVMEATGVYYLDLALMLQGSGLPLSVINPASFKRFSELTLTQSKTDAIDAALLAEFAERMEPRLWEAPSTSAVELRDLGRQINRITRDATKAKNRLHALKSKHMSSRILIEDAEEVIEYYEKRIARLTQAAMELINGEASLEARFKNIQSAKGIGQASAIAVLAEFAVLPADMKAKQVSRHSGLDVRLYQSGTSVKGASRISKAGNAYLRSALFMPAMSAARHDPNAKAFRDALVARGKKKIQANVAVMRKMLMGLWSSYVSYEPYDSAKLFSDIHQKA